MNNIRKYLFPNIPYVFALWFFIKLGTAYRIAGGTGFGYKLIGTIETIGPTLQNFAPGLHPSDWFIGIVGAIFLRIIVYYKVKNAKKFRRDVEYGSARWGA